MYVYINFSIYKFIYRNNVFLKHNYYTTVMRQNAIAFPGKQQTKFFMFFCIFFFEIFKKSNNIEYVV